MLLLQQLINISCLMGPQQQTCSSGFAAVGSCWDRQVDGLPTVSVQAVPLMAVKRLWYSS